MVKWISHRGESMDAPENTLAAFRLSQERQTDGMECDVYLTTDGKVMVCHDPNTTRMGSARLYVEKSSSADLRAITVSGAFQQKYPGEKIPFLSETFQFLGGSREYYIELKGTNPELIPALKAEVEKSGIPSEQIVFISFSRELIRGMKHAMPRCRALWLNDLRREYGIVSADELIAELEHLGVDGVDGWDHPDITGELVDAVHRAGKIFAVWTVDNPDSAAHLISCGVDVITSNCAALLQNW
ncbi:MAG: glycerophosphodiester phosphodiesterase [Lentisphaerae bacterium]|nr:glycerophosphodiester phosphodiesterase [Lentisphaerota bacterium]